MRPSTPRPLFLERETYHRARIIDGARLMPLLGLAVLVLPNLLLSEPALAQGATARWLVYFFAAWGTLVGLTLLQSRRMVRAGLVANVAGPAPDPAAAPDPAPLPDEGPTDVPPDGPKAG
jgi:hypothetical protein